MHYTSHPSEQLLKAYLSTKGKISIGSREDLVTLQESAHADVLHTGNKNFVFDFSAREIEVADIGTSNLIGWFEPARPNGDNLTTSSS